MNIYQAGGELRSPARIYMYLYHICLHDCLARGHQNSLRQGNEDRAMCLGMFLNA
jgi:hypothetical protein